MKDEEVKNEQINSEVEEANVVPKFDEKAELDSLAKSKGYKDSQSMLMEMYDGWGSDGNIIKDENGNYTWEGANITENQVDILKGLNDINSKKQSKEKAPRELFYERIRTNFPEGKYDEDEDEYYRNAMQMFDDNDNAMNVVRDNNEKLFKRLESDPSAAAALAEFIDGAPLPVALRRYFTDEELSAQEGDDYFESYKKAGEERDAHKKEVNDYIEKIKANSTESEKNFKEYAEENGLTPEESDKMWEYYQNLMNEMSTGMISKDFLSLMHKGRNYNQDVEDANEAGKAAGRNEKIVEKLSKPKGDGLPEPTGGKAGVEPKEKRQIDEGVQMFRNIATRASKSKWD